MRIKRHILAFIAIIILTFSLPIASTASQSLVGSGIRVIELSAAGNDIANSVVFSPDGNWLAVGTSSGIAVFDSQTLSQERFITTGVWVRSVVFSPDGGTIAAGLFDIDAIIQAPQ